MNEAHLHLVVNHLPIVIPIAAVVVLAVGIIIKSEVVKRVSYLLFIIASVSTMAAFSTGEGAEEIAEGLPGVTERLIHEHEEKAESFALLNYILGCISLISIWASWKQKQFAKWLSVAILLFAFIVIFKGREVGTSGGEIRHTEIRKGAKIQNEDQNEDQD